MTSRTRSKFVALILVAGSLAACGSSSGSGDDDTSGGDTTTPTGDTVTLNVTFSPMYSAYDGTHTFKLPVLATGGAGNVTFTASDSSMVDIVATSATGATLTTRKAGTTTIKGTDTAGNFGTAKLTVTQGDPADWELGKERYNNGVAAFAEPDGGVGMTMEPGAFNPDPESACTFCHKPDGAGTTSTGSPIDIEHTPQQTGGYSDDDLVNIFTKGQKPAGVGTRLFPSATAWQRIHQWKVEENVKKGIVLYLRSLEPKAQGELDFGGLMGGGPGGDGGFAAPSSSTLDAGTAK